MDVREIDRMVPTDVARFGGVVGLDPGEGGRGS